MRNIKDIYYSIKRGIKNLWFYIPIIWDNNDWDHGYCLDLYIQSLKRLNIVLETDEIHVRSKHDTRKLKATIYLLERYTKEDYTEQHINEVNKKYGITEEDIKFEFEAVPGKPFFRVVNKIEARLSKEIYTKYRKDISLAMTKANNIQQNEFKLALKYIERNSRRWWS